MSNTNAKVMRMTMFLLKDYVTDFSDCIKGEYAQSISPIPVKKEFGFDGLIYCPEAKSKDPTWKDEITSLASSDIQVGSNTSNKAIIIAKISGRFMAVVYGYGRSLLKEDLIERNFGLKVALNLISPERLRSIDAATIEDSVLLTQRQLSKNSNQSEFGLNVLNDIMKGVTGQLDDEAIARQISGHDTLVITARMTIPQMKEKLEYFLKSYKKDDYTKRGFDWVDNIRELKDSSLKEDLDESLFTAIRAKDTSNMFVSPSEIIDWDRVSGFCFSGMNKKTNDIDSYSIDITIEEYVNSIKPGVNLRSKLAGDRLLAWNDSGPYPTGSVYKSLIFQTTGENGHLYILVSGTWYVIDTDFCNEVDSFVRNIPISDLEFPDCDNLWHENRYNEVACSTRKEYHCLDQKLIYIEGGRNKVEACDIFVEPGQFVHVKNKGSSANLSHLFAQGRISAACFISHADFRIKLLDRLKSNFGIEPFDPQVKPDTKNYEVIYAIIDKSSKSLVDSLPFFSKLNLMIAAQDLDRMQYRCSIKKIPKI